MRGDRLLQLGHEELAVVVQESVERLEDVRRRKVELVEDDPVAPSHSLDQGTLLKRQITCWR